MKDDFRGDIKDLQKIVKDCGYTGEWTEPKPSKSGTNWTKVHTCKVSVWTLQWWPSTNTISFQGTGNKDFKEKILSAITAGGFSDKITRKQPENKKIFIVYGHDKDARDQLELILRRIGLDVFILGNSSNSSKTIIEALEGHICNGSFGIVLLTPDDYGYSKDKTEVEREPRARQNAILEMGMIMGTLGRNRMAILKKGSLEMPSDLHGILRIEYNDHVEEVTIKIGKALEDAGFDINVGKLVQ